MVRVAGDPALLQGAGRAGAELASGLRVDADALREALAALAGQPSEVDVGVDDLAWHLHVLANGWTEVALDMDEVGRALWLADLLPGLGGVVLDEVLARIAGERRHDDAPWEVDRERVDQALARIRDELDGGIVGGVRSGHLDGIQDALEGLTGPEADAVLRALSDDELSHWFGEMHDGWFGSGWSRERRMELYAVLGSKVSLDTWRRLAEHTDDVDPPPRGALGDTASPSPARAAWFDGLEYRFVDGVLVAAGPGDAGAFAFDDARQGSIGDCYLIAAMQSLAMFDPGAVREMFRANPNGTWTVTFADGQQVVVSPDLVVDPDTGEPAFADLGPGADGTELWPMLLEKAYAQRNGGWDQIVGGSMSDAIEELTGRPSGYIDADDVHLDDLADRFDRGEILGLSTIDAPDQDDVRGWLGTDAPDTFTRGDSRWDRLHQNHAFIVTDVDPAAGTVSVVNPWDPTQGPVVLTESELRESVNGVRISEVVE